MFSRFFASQYDIGKWIQRHSDWLIATLVISVIGMMIVPLPTQVIDVLLSLNIALAVVLLMVSLYIGNALQFASFPTILLIATLFRLGLNVSTTRLILRDANAGEVVRSFGEFVVAGNIVVGAVVFLILTVIQFVVIAKGSERVAEVAARFSLDAMPGKQMAIDADVRAGHIGQEDARRRRENLERESQLYGSMDGAMKFVKGDAIAGILITVINIIGGLIIGIGMRDMSLVEASRDYTVLTIGDGLVSQIPALVISLSAAMVVTRVSSEGETIHVGYDIVKQIFAHPRAILATSILLLVLGVVPGLPLVPFWILGIGTGIVARQIQRSRITAKQAIASVKDGSATSWSGVLPIVLEVSPDLAVSINAENDRGSFITTVIPQIREAIYHDMGVLIPAVRLRTGTDLVQDPEKSGQFTIELFEVPALHGWMAPDLDIVDADKEALHAIGIQASPALHPISGRSVSAVSFADTVACREAGYSVWQVPYAMGMTLAGVLRKHADMFLGIQETRVLVDIVESTYPTLVAEVVPNNISLQLLADVLRRLIQEQVSIRNLPHIIQALADSVPNALGDAETLTEAVRIALRRQITMLHATQGVIEAWLVDPFLEDTLKEALHTTETGTLLALDPKTSHDIISSFHAVFNESPVKLVVTSLEIRRYLRRLLALECPDVAVLSFQELLPEIQLHPVGRITVGNKIPSHDDQPPNESFA